MSELENNKARIRTEKSKRWLYLYGRKEFNSLDKITKHTFCSLHFESLSGPTEENPEPFHANSAKKIWNLYYVEKESILKMTICGKQKKP